MYKRYNIRKYIRNYYIGGITLGNQRKDQDEKVIDQEDMKYKQSFWADVLSFIPEIMSGIARVIRSLF